MTPKGSPFQTVSLSFWKSFPLPVPSFDRLGRRRTVPRGRERDELRPPRRVVGTVPRRDGVQDHARDTSVERSALRRPPLGVDGLGPIRSGPSPLLDHPSLEPFDPSPTRPPPSTVRRGVSPRVRWGIREGAVRILQAYETSRFGTLRWVTGVDDFHPCEEGPSPFPTHTDKETRSSVTVVSL